MELCEFTYVISKIDLKNFKQLIIKACKYI